jgi:hypothetical protein
MQVGMAVPVRGAQVVFEALFNTFMGRDYEFVEANMQKHVEAALKIGE